MDLTDNQLIKRIRQGEHPLFSVLVERYSMQIYNLMYRFSGNREEAADLTQDVFCKAFEKLSSYRAGKSFFAWIYTTALNHARDWKRKQYHYEKKKLSFGMEEGNFTTVAPEYAVEAGQRNGMLYDALSRLPEDRREMVILRYRHDHSIRELADIFDLSESAVKMRLSRAISDLGQVLKEADDD